ncbi:hypothetical protein D3C73_1406160 [compost metagenome]
MIIIFNVPFGLIDDTAAVFTGYLLAALLHPVAEVLLEHVNNRGQRSQPLQLTQQPFERPLRLHIQLLKLSVQYYYKLDDNPLG